MPEMPPVGGASPMPPPGLMPPPGARPPQAGAPGPTPGTMPTPNQGQHVAGLAMIGVIVKLMERAIPLLGAGTEAGRDLVKSLSSLSRHVPAGALSPGIENTAIERLALQNRQNGPQVAAMRAAAPPGTIPPHAPSPMPQAA